MPQARVTAEHRAPQRPAIQVRAGAHVRLGEHDGQWPQFVWTAQANDDTRELDADTGELLTVHHAPADWWRAENRHGAQGWVPARNIELTEGQP